MSKDNVIVQYLWITSEFVLKNVPRLLLQSNNLQNPCTDNPAPKSEDIFGIWGKKIRDDSCDACLPDTQTTIGYDNTIGISQYKMV